jgi:HK97 family phage major capsid protein
MPDIEEVLADAQREIKAIGDNVKSLKETTDKSLADVRKLVDDTPKSLAGSDQFKKDVEALVAGVVEKHDAIATKVKQLTDGALKGAADRMDEIEKKLNRGKLGAGWGDTDEGTKAAKAFARDAKAIRHELKADFDPDKVDIEEVKAYCSAFPVYLRKDDKGLRGAEVKAISVGSDPDGGYMVTPAVGQIITGVQFETSPMRAVDAARHRRQGDAAEGRRGPFHLAAEPAARQAVEPARPRGAPGGGHECSCGCGTACCLRQLQDGLHHRRPGRHLDPA